VNEYLGANFAKLCIYVTCSQPDTS